MLVVRVMCSLVVIGILLGLCAYAVLAERKISAWIQGRIGPSRTVLPWVIWIPFLGPFLRKIGFFQPLADGLKFLFKEDPIPDYVNKFYYVLAPILALTMPLTMVALLPYGEYWSDGDVSPIALTNLDMGMLIFLLVSALSVYGTLLGGWASNSKYSLLGGIRAGAQLISYEIVMMLSVLSIFLCLRGDSSLSFSIYEAVQGQHFWWNIFLQPLTALLFLIALFAETNRLPFDMPESETDLVSGAYTEYGSFKLGLFFTAEYAHMIVGSGLFVLLFLGGWHFLPGIPFPWPENWFGSILSVFCFLTKTCFMVFFFMWVRWTLPRFRYDQVMNLGWQAILPLALFNLVLNMILDIVCDKIRTL